MITTAVACGAGGALLGTLFHKTVHLMKDVVWSKKKEEKPWKRQLAVKTTIGLIVGILSTYYPQTLFWGEGSLQTVIDGQKTAFGATTHGLSGVLTSMAKVNSSLPFASSAAAGCCPSRSCQNDCNRPCVRWKVSRGDHFPTFLRSSTVCTHILNNSWTKLDASSRLLFNGCNLGSGHKDTSRHSPRF